MNSNLERALMLYQQSRHELAENELRQSLASEPQSAYAHALLALCLAQRENFQEATNEAQQAIHLEPDFPFAHFLARRVCSRTGIVFLTQRPAISRSEFALETRKCGCYFAPPFRHVHCGKVVGAKR